MQIRREGMEEVKSSLADVVSKPDRTFKELSGSEKVRFILDYYKWHILAGVVVLGVIISMINHYAFHNQATQLYGLGVNLSAESDVCEAFKAEYEEYAGIDKRHYTNVFECSRCADLPNIPGVIFAVPVTMCQKIDRDKIEVVGLSENFGQSPELGHTGRIRDCFYHGKRIFKRVFVRVKPSV